MKKWYEFKWICRQFWEWLCKWHKTEISSKKKSDIEADAKTNAELHANKNNKQNSKKKGNIKFLMMKLLLTKTRKKIVYIWFVQYAKLILFIHHESVLSNIFEVIFNFNKPVGKW